MKSISERYPSEPLVALQHLIILVGAERLGYIVYNLERYLILLL